MEHAGRSVDEQIETYTTDVIDRSNSVPDRQPVDELGQHNEDAKRAAPNRRKAYDPVTEAGALVVLRAGLHTKV